jgi:hypothetical protein
MPAELAHVPAPLLQELLNLPDEEKLELSNRLRQSVKPLQVIPGEGLLEMLERFRASLPVGYAPDDVFDRDRPHL